VNTLINVANVNHEVTTLSVWVTAIYLEERHKICRRAAVRPPIGINLIVLPLSPVTASQHYLPRSLRSIVTCDKASTTVTWSASIFAYLQCYCYTTKANSRTIRSQVSQSASARREANLVNCKLITACYQNSL